MKWLTIWDNILGKTAMEIHEVLKPVFREENHTYLRADKWHTQLKKKILLKVTQTRHPLPFHTKNLHSHQHSYLNSQSGRCITII